MFKSILKFLAILLIVAQPVLAADVYVRKGASGSGASWSDALGQLPTSVVRNGATNTYWIADTEGSDYYDNRTINAAVSGANTIVVKKATIAEHGTDTGWNNSYGDGIARWGNGTSGGFNISETSYITIDGYSPHAPDGRGFIIPIVVKSPPNGGYKGIYMGNFSGTQVQYIKFKGIDIQGPDTGGSALWYDIDENTWGFYAVSFTAGYRYIHFDNVKISRFETLFQCANMDDITFENGELSYSRQANTEPLSPHANVMFIQSSLNLIFRYNKMHNWDITGIYVNGGDTVTGYQIYGNRFYDTLTESAGAVYVAQDTTLSGAKVYNNTFVNVAWPLLRYSGTGPAVVTGMEWYNNIHDNNAQYGYLAEAGVTKSYNWFSGSTTYGANAIAGGSTDPFVARSSKNFALTNEITGMSLGTSSVYDVDGNGVVRSANTTWSMGAFEYTVGATYYVSPYGNDSNNGSSGTPWLTIGKADSTLVAGDTVNIRAGSYSENISPANSGTESSRITYQAYTGETVTITGSALQAIVLNGKDYITVSGILVTNVAQFLQGLDAQRNIITNCTFAYANYGAYYGGIQFENSSKSNIVINSTLHHWGGDTASGNLIDIGDESDPSDASSFNIIEGCTIYAAGHAVIQFRCGYNVLRNNWIRNDPWTPGGWGMRCILLDGYGSTQAGHHLIDGNRISYGSAYASSDTSSGLDVRDGWNIIRRNVFFNNTDGGVTIYTSSSGDLRNFNKIYNNAFMTNGLGSLGGNKAIRWLGVGSGIHSVSNSIINNVYYRHAASPVAYDSQGPEASQFVRNNRSAVESSEFVDVTTSYTATTVGLPNMNPQAGSPLINAGDFLANITSSSGSGTSFNVDDATYFFAGLMHIPGDTIRFEGTSQTAVVTGISGNTITVNNSVSWTSGQGIALDYISDNPDIGAFEFVQHYYLDPNITTGGDGKTWATAWKTAAAAEAGAPRGSIIYVADGTLTGLLNCDTPVNGTQTIEWRKATASDHGSDIGWVSTMGDGVTSFSSTVAGGATAFTATITFSSAYWIFNGVSGGGPESWQSGAGFEVNHTEKGQGFWFLASNISVSHTKITGNNGTQDGNSDHFNVGTSSNISVSYCYTTQSGRCIIFSSATTSDILFERNYFGSIQGFGEVHGEFASIWGNPSNWTFRYNLITDVDSTGGIMWDNSANPSGWLDFYGNIVYDIGSAWGSHPNGFIGGWTPPPEDCNNIRVYNNTFVTVDAGTPVLGTFMGATGSGLVAKNNLFYSCDSAGGTAYWSVSHNHFISTTTVGTSTSTSVGDPFVNLTGLNFALTTDTPAADTSIDVQYRTDMFGNVGDTRGAIQFTVPTYFIDYVGGSDANDGRSKATPWKHHPYMQGWTGSGYSHTAGDRFIFKGGVTWPKEALYMALAAGGNSGAWDYYGVDSTWYIGESWSRPIFDGEYVDAGGIFTQSYSYIVFDSIEIKRIKKPDNPVSDGYALFHRYTSDFLTLTNMYLHGWRTAQATDGAHGGLVSTGSDSTVTTNLLLVDSIISNAENFGGSGGDGYNGVCVRAWGTLRNSIIQSNSSAILFALDVDGCEIFDITGAVFDGVYHANGLYLDPQTLGKNIGYVRNTKFRNSDGGANMAYLNGRSATIYCVNNVFDGTISDQGAILIDTYAYESSAQTGYYYVHNNTGSIESGTALVRLSTLSATTPIRPAPLFISTKNNHVIGTSVSAQSGVGNAVTWEDGNHLVQTAATATSQGYTAANFYAPTDSGDSTVNAGTDTGTIFTKDILGVNRPQNSVWDIGAFEFNAGGGVAPTINTHPSSQTISSGATANMSVSATGDAPLTYQWYQGASGNTGTPISGATSSSYTTPALSSTTQYWVRVSNGTGTADSNTATITVNTTSQSAGKSKSLFMRALRR